MCGTCQVLEICIEVCFHSKQVFILVPRKKKERKNIIQSDTSNWSSEIVGINCMHESCMREFQFPFHFFFWPPVTHAWPVIFSLCIIHCRAHGQSWWRKTTWGNDRAAPASFLGAPAVASSLVTSPSLFLLSKPPALFLHDCSFCNTVLPPHCWASVPVGLFLVYRLKSRLPFPPPLPRSLHRCLSCLTSTTSLRSDCCSNHWSCM